MTIEPAIPSQPGGAPNERSDLLLARFFATNNGAVKAASALKEGAEVGIRFADSPDEWRAVRKSAGPMAFETGRALDPDFTLDIPRTALIAICARDVADLGDLGVAFFEHIVAKQPELKIRVQVHSGVIKLTRRGWLSLLAQGGPKVVMWMAKKGLRGPGAVATVLGRLQD